MGVGTIFVKTVNLSNPNEAIVVKMLTSYFQTASLTGRFQHVCCIAFFSITVQTTLSHFSFALCLHQGQKCPDAMPI
jgi:hypothetical protein